MIIDTKVYSCRKCQSKDLVKDGTNSSGSSQYHCKACGAYGVLERKELATEEKKELICWMWMSCGPLSFVAKTKCGSGLP